MGVEVRILSCALSSGVSPRIVIRSARRGQCAQPSVRTSRLQPELIFKETYDEMSKM